MVCTSLELEMERFLLPVMNETCLGLDSLKVAKSRTVF